MENTHIHHDKSAVIHKVPALKKGHCSAFLDSSGNLVEAEQFTSFGQYPRPVKKNGPLWNHVAGRARIIYQAALNELKPVS